jgi:DNA polymerase
MPILIRDYETRSTLDLGKVGAWQYATHADVWCCAYAVDDGPIKLWVPGDPPPEEFALAARDPEYVVCAFNDGFERLIEQHILGPRYGWPQIPIERHCCLQAAALAQALPASLEGVAEALKLEHQKDVAGAAVMKRLAQLRPGENPSADELERLYAYCRQDVAVERELHARIPALIPAEQELFELDAKISARGIHIDRPLLDAAIQIAETAQRELNAELIVLTEADIQTVGQADRLLAWLAAHDCTVTDLKKDTLKAALRRKSIPPEARRVIEVRLAGAHAAASKFETLRDWCGADNRARGWSRFHGAATGRWTSFGVQLHNMKKPEVEDLEAAIAVVATGNFHHVRQRYPQPLAVVGDCARAMLCAAPGHRLIAGDLSGIESRVTAFLARQQSKLEQWAKFDETQDPEDEPYTLLGRQIGFEGEQARTLGKICDLAFGYQGGLGAWKKLAPADDTSTEIEIKRRQQAWRDAHPKVVRFWHALDHAATRALQMPGLVFAAGRVAFSYDGCEFLRMQLPSGRKIAYPFPRLIRNSRGNLVVTFQDNAAGRWTEARHGQGMYGGVWCENAVQACARDLFAAAMLRLEAAGYSIVLHVHDECAAEVPEGAGSEEQFRELLITPPDWAVGLPLAAKVRESMRFAKVSEPDLSTGETSSEDPGELEKLEEPTSAEPVAADLDDGCDDLFHGPRSSSSTTQPELAAEAEPIAVESVITAPVESLPPPPLPRDADDYAHCGNSYRHGGNGYASGEREWGEELASYIYRDATGQPYLRVRRTSTKQFPQYHWENGRWVKGKPKGPRIPYQLPEILAAAPALAVFICEGEKDADRVAALGLIATTNPEGAGKWTADLNKWFTGKQRVNVLEDNDDAGRAHAAKVAGALYGIVPDVRIVAFRELPENGDVSDWLAAGRTREELIARADAAPRYDGAITLDSARASAFTMAAIQWVWPGRFAIGKLGVIAGLPAEGKGLILGDVAARITRGLPWPCSEGRAPLGNVLLLTAEDDTADTVIPRLQAAGADLERIEIVRMVRDTGKQRMFSLVTDLYLLRQKVIEVGDVRMIQIDPISAYFGIGKIDSFRGTDVRAVLSPLIDLASDLKVAVLGIMHFNKRVDIVNALLRISDSVAFSAAPRHVYAVVNDPERRRKILVKAKNNLAPHDQKALAYDFAVREVGRDEQTGETICAPHIVWHAEHVDVTASEAMQAAAEGKAPAARDSAKTFLEDLLANGPVGSADVEEAAEANGITRRTLFRAKAELGIQAVKDGPVKDGQRIWRWHRKEEQ